MQISQTKERPAENRPKSNQPNKGTAPFTGINRMLTYLSASLRSRGHIARLIAGEHHRGGQIPDKPIKSVSRSSSSTNRREGAKLLGSAAVRRRRSRSRSASQRKYITNAEEIRRCCPPRP